MLAATALAIAAVQAQPPPSCGAVWSAVDRDLNTRCDGRIESADCVTHPSSVRVRRLACEPEAGDRARCRYQRRIATVGGRRGRWEAAETRFHYHRGTMIWSVDRDFPLTPDRADVKGALHWQAGSLCRTLIDACLDENGNDINPLPEFTVSALDCRPGAGRRATCSFTSMRGFGPNRIEPSERCTGTLVRRDGDGGEASWTFFVPDPRRRPYSALLRCN